PAAWQGIDFDHRGGPGPAGAPWRPRGIRVLLSDLLWEGGPLLFLRHFTDRAAVAVVVQVLAKADVDPPEGGSLRLVDAEPARVREVQVDAVVARRYREALARHQANWERACRQSGALLTVVTAEQVLQDWRLDDLVAAEVLKVV